LQGLRFGVQEDGWESFGRGSRKASTEESDEKKINALGASENPQEKNVEKNWNSLMINNNSREKSKEDSGKNLILL